VAHIISYRKKLGTCKQSVTARFPQHQYYRSCGRSRQEKAGECRRYKPGGVDRAAGKPRTVSTVHFDVRLIHMLL
jgi:hypothetical protein